MVSYEQKKQKILEDLKRAADLAGELKEKQIQQRFENADRQLRQGKLTVVVCGEFKQGKSSLINAILNEAELFPVDIDITTNLVSTITYGEREKITIALKEASKAKEKKIQRKDIPDYVTEQNNKNNHRQARLLAIEVPNPQLKEGLVLVDTPGVGSLYSQHTDVSYAFIPNADVVIFVSDAYAPLSAKELEFVKKIDRHCQNIIFVVTKIDSAPDYETIIKNNREKLATVLDKSGDEIKIVAVSSALKQEYLKSQDDEDLEDSNFPEFESYLWQLLSEQKGKILLVQALKELGRGIAELKVPIQAELKAFDLDREESKEIENKLQTIKKRLQSLQENNANWRNKLNDGLADIRTKALADLDSNFTRIRRQSEEYLNNKSLLDNPQQIIESFQDDINGFMFDIYSEISQESTHLKYQIEDATELNLNPFELGSIDLKKDDISIKNVTTEELGAWQQSTIVMRGTMMTVSPFAFFGGIIGGIAPAAGVAIAVTPVGIAVGAVAGLGLVAIGVKEGISQLEKQKTSTKKQEIAPFVRSFVEDSKALCRRKLNETIVNLTRFMRDEFAEKIRQEKELCDRTLKSLSNGNKLSGKAAQVRAKILSLQSKKIATLEKYWEQMTEVLVSSNSRGGNP